MGRQSPLLRCRTLHGGFLDHLIFKRLQHLWRRHRMVAQAHPDGVVDRVSDRRQRRDDRHFAYAADTVGMIRVRDLDDFRVDERHVRRHRHAVIEEARVFKHTLIVIDVFLVQRGAYALNCAAPTAP